VDAELSPPRNQYQSQQRSNNGYIIYRCHSSKTEERFCYWRRARNNYKSIKINSKVNLTVASFHHGNLCCTLLRQASYSRESSELGVSDHFHVIELLMLTGDNDKLD
jgi:hypothetical protein